VREEIHGTGDELARGGGWMALSLSLSLSLLLCSSALSPFFSLTGCEREQEGGGETSGRERDHRAVFTTRKRYLFAMVV